VTSAAISSAITSRPTAVEAASRPFAQVLGEPGQMAVQAAGQPLGQPQRRRADQS